jgi:hypothetical protein
MKKLIGLVLVGGMLAIGSVAMAALPYEDDGTGSGGDSGSTPTLTDNGGDQQSSPYDGAPVEEPPQDGPKVDHPEDATSWERILLILGLLKQ